MRETYIILLDGLPCAGKSTTTQRLGLHLRKQGIDVRWVLELDEAYPVLTAPQYQALLSSRDNCAEVLSACDEQAEVAWKQLAADLQDTQRILCIECAVFQNPIASLLLMGVEPADIIRHVLRLFDAISPLHPVLIYLYPGRPAATAADLAEKRGEAFVNYLIGAITKTPYGRQQHIHNRAGLTRAWEALKAVADEIFARLSLPKLALDTQPGDWHRYFEQMADFLSIPPFEPVPNPFGDLSSFAGAYYASHSSEPLIIEADAEGLHIGMQPKFRLIHQRELTFYLEGLPGTISFTQTRAGQIAGFRGEGSLPELNAIWEKA